MEIKFKTAIKDDKEYIIFEREDFEAFIDHTMKLNQAICESVESYFGRINFKIDEIFVKKHNEPKNQS